MKNAIIMHGSPDKEEYYDPKEPSMSNAHWIPWLQAQLLKANIAAATPEVPRSFEYSWATWVKEFERFDITPETILIGHSTGCALIIKYLSIHPETKVGKVVLIAPWLDPDQRESKSFFHDFDTDANMARRTTGITIFGSDNDQDSVQETVKIIREKVAGVKYTEFHNYGHFCFGDMKTTEFPELLEEILL